jgi:hypothetical protein
MEKEIKEKLLKKLLSQFEARKDSFQKDYEQHHGDNFNNRNIIPKLQCYGNWQAMQEVISNIKYELRHL